MANDNSKNKTNERKDRIQRAPTLYELTDATFLNALKIFKNNGRKLRVNDYILGQMKGYPPWPARVQGFTKDGSKLKCYFFGTHNTGSVGSKLAIPFEDSFEVVRLIKLRQPHNFIKGVLELEIELGVPKSLSSVKDTAAISN